MVLIVCTNCGRSLKSQTGLKLHLKKCNEKLQEKGIKIKTKLAKENPALLTTTKSTTNYEILVPDETKKKNHQKYWKLHQYSHGENMMEKLLEDL